MKNKATCEYQNICSNYPLKCHKCVFNRNLKLKNYLKIKKGNKEIRYLGDSDEGV